MQISQQELTSINVSKHSTQWFSIHPSIHIIQIEINPL